MCEDTMTTLEAAIGYRQRGWCPTAIPARSKNPGRAGWQNERWTEAELPSKFNGTGNIGVILGTASGGLVDIDLDCDEAIVLVEGFLPDTGCVFGRIGKPQSHRLYTVSPVPVTSRYRDPGGAMIVESRSSGAQTIFPPSVHPGGEAVAWESFGDAAVIDADALRSGVARLAAAALLARRWPNKGSRHDVAMALAGGLGGAGWDREYVTELVEAIARVGGDEEAYDRRRVVAATFDRNDGRPITGWRTLAGLIGDDVVARVREWFGVCRQDESPATWTKPTSKPGKTPKLERLNMVRCVPIGWLWPGFIPAAKLSLLSSDPGLGKSTLGLNLAARLSIGAQWPNRTEGANTPGGVVILSAEDALPDVVVPRLKAAGADLGRIVALEGVQIGDEVKHFSLRHDLPVLEAAIEQCPGCRLVIIDPISAFLLDVESREDASVRGVLAPLSKLAERHGVAVLAITHLNKDQSKAGIYRSMASIGFTAAVRAAFIVVKDRDDPERRSMLPVKCNLTRSPVGLAYRVEPWVKDPTIGVVQWEPDPIEGADLDQALAPGARASAVDSAAAWLEDVLTKGALPVGEIRERAKDERVSWGSVIRAKGDLEIEATREGFGQAGRWIWALP